MRKHDGQILEYQIRKAGYRLSDLAVSLGVNRRTLYNLFNSEVVKPDYIIRIGKIIRHDFSHDFPNTVKPEDFNIPKFKTPESKEGSKWKDKYINLLEKYNDLLLRISQESK